MRTTGAMSVSFFSTLGILISKVAVICIAHLSVAPGDRIAQLVLEKISTPEVIEVEDLDNTDRVILPPHPPNLMGEGCRRLWIHRGVIKRISEETQNDVVVTCTIFKTSCTLNSHHGERLNIDPAWVLIRV
jgi:hypothetical protein